MRRPPCMDRTLSISHIEHVTCSECNSWHVAAACACACMAPAATHEGQCIDLHHEQESGKTGEVGRQIRRKAPAHAPFSGVQRAAHTAGSDLPSFHTGCSKRGGARTTPSHAALRSSRAL